MNKIVISGFYGFHNIGDEAILRTLTTQLRAIDPAVQITVLSNHPEETRQKFNVRAVDRSNAFRVFTEIMKCSMLISGGGSLLQDVTSARSIHYYLSIIRAGIFFRKRVILLSHGVGPLIRPKNRHRVRSVLNRVNVITVRDVKSAELLESIGVDMKRVSITTDPVMGMPMADPEIGSAILKRIGAWETSRKRVAIAIRQKDFRNEERRTKLLTLTDALAKQYEVYYLPFYYKNDTKIYDDLHDKVGEHVHFVVEKYQSQEFMSLVQNMDLLIGARLHSLIFALVAEVPFIGISYDPKIDNFLETISQNAVCGIEDFNPEAVLSHVESIFEHYDESRRIVQNEKAMLKARLTINETILNQLLRSEGQ
ncbi:polysaccharide pyruvyl transferase CsaB [Fusibacter paucivorans]|uniref:Polysaccharide pyruvyl transferase CsaB n=1 Tax=Fusibacter paucivorans TaxID=76009 RepID=A0ABS5PPA7_9FIRM|nr:polysaccharide pyruvyl transferase CsaB [Fusibacter paucivorans]MBS7527008.1 polysaccharide pyruvyl transferase CsaB [Fusibacter paucivorans]